LDTKYTPCHVDRAIYGYSNGFGFGNAILDVSGSKLNDANAGICKVGTNNYYFINGIDNGKSPLTGQNERFTAAEIEVYRVFW
jgi:hypothetical protein